MSRLVKSVLILTLIATFVSCASRYRLDMFMTFEDTTNKVKVKSTQLVMDAVLGDPMAEDKVTPGPEDVLVVTFETRWRSLEGADYPVLQFDENLTSMLYLELPSNRKAPTTIDLKNASLIHVLGRYEQPPEAKLFLPDSGTLVIDSVKADRSYFTIDGKFTNSYKHTFRLNGSFKAKTEN